MSGLKKKGLAVFRQLWRMVPVSARLGFRNLLNEVSFCSVAHGRQIKAGNVVIAGLFGAGTGIGQVARLMARQLRVAGYEVAEANLCCFPGMPRDFDGGALRPVGAGDHGAALVVVNPDFLNIAKLAVGLRHSRRRIIGSWAWELDKVPASWVKAMDAVDEVWAPSRFIADALLREKPQMPVYVVPYPCVVLPCADVPEDKLLKAYAGRVVVFFGFDVRSNYARKNPEAVIEVFKRVALDNPKALLVIKVKGEAAWPLATELLARAVGGASNILILRETLSDGEMAALMARVDIVMSLHRSEGFGLLMAEAMGAGKPVIATNWSGNVDFMTAETSFLVDCKLVPVVDPQGEFDRFGAEWAEVDQAQAASALKRLLDDPVLRQETGRKAQAHIKALYDDKAWSEALPESFKQNKR